MFRLLSTPEVKPTANESNLLHLDGIVSRMSVFTVYKSLVNDLMGMNCSKLASSKVV